MDPQRAGAFAAAQRDGGRAGSRTVGHQPLYLRVRSAAAACGNAEYRLLSILMSFDGDGQGVKNQSVETLAIACGKVNEDGEVADKGFVVQTLRRLTARGFVSVEPAGGSKAQRITIHYDAILASAGRKTPTAAGRKTPTAAGRKTPTATGRKTPTAVVTMEHRNSAGAAREWAETKGFVTSGWNDADYIRRYREFHHGTLPKMGDP